MTERVTQGSVTRREVVAGVAAVLAGCSGRGGDSPAGTDEGGDEDGNAGSNAGNPVLGDVTQRGDLRLTSPAFSDGGRIPRRYGHDAENVNPPLTIRGVPSAARSMTLVVDDPDAVDPAGKVWLHWLVWNIPPDRTDVPTGWKPETAVEGVNDFGDRGYDGPDPPDGPHTYRFKLFALDETLDLPASASKRRVGEAMRGSVLAQTQLEGTYAP